MLEALRLDSDSAFDNIINAARDTNPVTGLTHNFYRYPARFSPPFVRSVIEALSEPGDLVVDPFMGGGTTLVESLALGRDSLGTDISSLAAFVSEAKTAVLSDKEIRAVERWLDHAFDSIHMQRPAPISYFYQLEGYYKNLTSAVTWRYRKSIEQVLGTTHRLRTARSKAFARCILLRTAQWALDGRRNFPSIPEFREHLLFYANEMLSGAKALSSAVDDLSVGQRSPICLHRSAIGLEGYFAEHGLRSPRLVLTSPPYPGIHVLYHRWQVDGRKETPAPFWIADKLDGAGSSFYTMGDRKYPALATYFNQLRAAFSSVAAICNDDTTIVQMVGFSEPDWQLPQYLAVMEAAGLRELRAPKLDAGDGRLWRSVPNRKWHADQLGDIHASREVVLFHRKAA